VPLQGGRRTLRFSKPEAEKLYVAMQQYVAPNEIHEARGSMDPASNLSSRSRKRIYSGHPLSGWPFFMGGDFRNRRCGPWLSKIQTMGRRRKKQGPEEAVAGLVGLAALYLVVTHHVPQFLKLLAILAGVGLLIAVGLVLVRRRRRAAAWSAPASARRMVLKVHQAPRANPDPDVLDRVRAMPDPTPAAVSSQALSAPTWSVALIRALEWKRFEELCEGYWKAKGYRAELTGRGADGGIDIKLYRPSAPDQLLAVIQCKSRTQDKLGVATARELFGVMHHVNAPMGILVTSSGFHAPAREFAVGKHLQLVDGEALYGLLAQLPEADGQRLLSHVTRDDYITPTCPSCDIKMIKRPRKRDGEEFYGCRNFPQGCRQTFHLRHVH